jgi:hypothetical protein
VKVFRVEEGLEELFKFGFNEELLLCVEFLEFEDGGFLALGFDGFKNHQHLLDLLVVGLY